MNPIEKYKIDVIKASKRIQRNLEKYAENNNLEIPNVKKLFKNIVKLSEKDQKKRRHGFNSLFIKIFKEMLILDDYLLYIKDPDSYCEYLKHPHWCEIEDKECPLIDTKHCELRKKQQDPDEIIYEGMKDLNPLKKND